MNTEKYKIMGKLSGLKRKLKYERCIICLHTVGFGVTTMARMLPCGKGQISKILKRHDIQRHPPGHRQHVKGCTVKRPKLPTVQVAASRVVVRIVQDRHYWTQIRRASGRLEEWRKVQNVRRQRLRLDSDPAFRALFYARKRVRQLMTYRCMTARFEYGQSQAVLPLIGCTRARLRLHIQSQFTGKMTWANYGKMWQLRHIEPLASFDRSNPVESLRKFSHWTNLYPAALPAKRVSIGTNNGH